MRISIVLTAITVAVLVLAGGNIASTSIHGKPVSSRTVGRGAVVHYSVQGTTQFSSSYTSLTNCGSGLTKAEEKEAEEHGTDLPSRCKGLAGYDVNISYSACSADISVDKGEESIHLATQSGNWKQNVEWRLANGKPFAVIFRVYEYAGSDLCATDCKIIAESLIVKGLNGYEHIDEEVKVKGALNLNLKARQLADAGYAKSRQKP